MEIVAGDCFLMPNGLPFGIGAERALPALDAMRSICSKTTDGTGITTFDGGGDCFIVGCHFALEGAHSGALTSLLPSIVHVRRESQKTEWRWILHRMKQELQEGQPGNQLVAQQTAYVMLVQALRLHLAERTTNGVGWLLAMSNESLKTVIDSMHESPSHKWTLQELALRAGMSRSVFSKRFKDAASETAIEYLTRLRMLLASDRLLNTKDSVTVIALSLGYDSESAFRKAFRKVLGSTPSQYGRSSGRSPTRNTVM